MDEKHNLTHNIQHRQIRLLEKVGKYNVLELPVWGFEDLSLNDKILLYYLWHAGAAGDRITYQQHYAHGLEIRDIFLELLQHKKDIDEVDETLYDKILTYTKMVVIHHGNHDARTTIKFLPEFTKEQLSKILETIGMKELSSELSKAIFEKNYEAMLTCKNPKTGDIITQSHNTFYKNVNYSDLQNFKDEHPLNSTVEKIGGMLKEHVWRAGNDQVPKGMYQSELANVIKNLHQAAKYCDESYAKTLKILIDYFETGNPKKFDEYNIEWLKNDSNVDTILGFIESYIDARGFKGLFESVIFYRDEESNFIVKKISENAQHLEDNSPWDEKYKKQWTTVPVANALVQLSGFGGDGPICAAGVNLPNEQWIREKHGSKNFYVSNITYTSRNFRFEDINNEFLESPEDLQLMKHSFKAQGPMLVTLHEVVGHGSGKVSPKLTKDPSQYLLENYSTLEECRADLCALYHAWDEKIISDGLWSIEDAKAMAFDYLYSYLKLLRRYDGEDEIHEDHERGRSIIIQYALEKGSCSFYKKNGKTYPKVNDYKLLRQHFGEILSQIMTIKAEGDYNAGKALVEKYGIRFDHKLRDEIVQRAKAIEYPTAYAYVMKKPELVKDGNGKIIDVQIQSYDSILEQAIDWKNIYG